MGIFLCISYLWAFPCIFPTCGYFSAYFLLVGIFLHISYLWAFLCVFLACGHFSVDFFNQGWDFKIIKNHILGIKTFLCVVPAAGYFLAYCLHQGWSFCLFWFLCVSCPLLQYFSVYCCIGVLVCVFSVQESTSDP